MDFCWFSSFLAYPNFFAASGRGADCAKAFIKLGEAAKDGLSYKEAKNLFPDLDPHQVETKKAAFQEFGLLFVTPGSNVLTLTPLGNQILELASDRVSANKNRRTVLLALARGLGRYQFNNPLPVGGKNKASIDRATSTDVLPYLACYYLLHKLGGLITETELRGAIFGLQKMSDIHTLEQEIRKQRKSASPFQDISGLPKRKGTASNLKIYFVSHLGIDFEILKESSKSNLYGGNDKIYEVSQLGFEVIESVLNSEWNKWTDKKSEPPKARKYKDIEAYFANGVGQACPEIIVASDSKKAEKSIKQDSEGILEEDDVKAIKELPRREYQEGHKKLVSHVRLEKTRNPTLIKDAKRIFKAKNGKLFCEICKFNFESHYGKRGKDFIEAHHRTPISELKNVVTLYVEDLAMVCSNCHRMLHRRPWITVDALGELLQ